MKKMPGRFTIQFNMDDPQQREAAAILERQGRRKAQFIAGAVRQYMQNDGASTSFNVGMRTVKRMMLELLNNDPDLSFASARIQDTAEKRQTEEIWDGTESEKTLAAISRTLAAFQKNP